MSQGSLFGTDGFRGEYTEKSGSALLNSETLYDLTRALIQYSSAHKIMVVGRDSRPSSSILAKSVISAGQDAGIEVWDLGVMPTPATFKVAQSFDTLAVMITASHNPYTDNGWKAAISGDKITNEEASKISDIYWQNLNRPPVSKDGGKLVDKQELSNWYIDSVVESIEKDFEHKPLSGKVFVIDGANGATMNFTPVILERLGAKVHRFACDGAGNINENCGAANLEGVKDYLIRHPEIINDPNFVGAIANDGDGDRMMGIGVDGSSMYEITGNHVLYALAQGQPGIVGTLYTNTGLVETLADQGIQFEQCRNGDTAVTAGLVARQAKGDRWTRGGEFTGHHVDTNWLSSGDGVRMAAWFASYVAKGGKTFSDVFKELDLWPEAKATIKINPQSPKVEENSATQDALGSIKELLGEDGRVVVRTSGTEPVVRVWGEAKKPHDIEQVVTQISGLIKTSLG